MARVTFSLDDATVARLRQTAARLGKPQSLVVREAVAEYAERADRLSDDERRRALAVLERLRTATATRTVAAVDAELRQLRADRRRGGRRHPIA
jgi:predicted transcriptional regulator